VNIPIVYEDDWIMVLNKPSGLLVIPTPRKESRTLSSILNQYAQENKFSYSLHPCHRLDRETSGLIIYAKGKSAQEKIMDQFRNREISKKYIAFVQGRLNPKEGQIKLPVEYKSAVTGYKVLDEREKFSVVELSPLTGRKNQIRIHFQRIGHPLVGETRFALRKLSPVKAKRACLHANSLTFKHPFTGKQLFIECSLASDMSNILDKEK
jgi:23S rRNA pseudouridine1911/1915/1917 synthase